MTAPIQKWDDLTALACLRMGYSIYSKREPGHAYSTWFLKTPFAGDLPCATEDIAFSTLKRLVGLRP